MVKDTTGLASQADLCFLRVLARETIDSNAYTQQCGVVRKVIKNCCVPVITFLDLLLVCSGKKEDWTGPFVWEGALYSLTLCNSIWTRRCDRASLISEGTDSSNLSSGNTFGLPCYDCFCNPSRHERECSSSVHHPQQARQPGLR